MPCLVNELEEMTDRNVDAVILKAIRRDDGAAAMMHLDAGRPIYYCEDEFSFGMIREWPNGRKELVHVLEDGSLIVLR
jgi:hypothetical protein